jgi:hypothetical protein
LREIADRPSESEFQGITPQEFQHFFCPYVKINPWVTILASALFPATVFIFSQREVPQHQMAYFKLTRNPLIGIFTPVKSIFFSFSLAAVVVVLALDEIEDGETGFGV